MATSKFAGLTREQKRELQKAWRRESWSVEIAFSTFKSQIQGVYVTAAIAAKNVTGLATE